MSDDFKKHLNHVGGQAIDFLLPPLCPATGEIVDVLGMVDPTYWQSLNFINAPFCEICGGPFAFEGDNLTCGHCMEHPPLYHQNRSALAYDDNSKSIILRFKHGDQTHAVKAFIPWLKNAGHELLTHTDIMIPVPLHPMRMIKRRYNQSDLIGRELSKHYPHIDYKSDGLKRNRNTEPQGHKKIKDRKKNISKAFEANPVYDFEDKTILIIDDVYTTGATLNECAKTLYRASAKQVNCLTVMKVIKD
jgi:ComF family protein